MLLPYALASLLRKVGASEFGVTVAEAFVKLALFLGYMFLISRMKDIQRTFMYHGAEHKCINCVEHGLPLTVENVMASSRQHKRCGTSFLFIVMFIIQIVMIVLYVMLNTKYRRLQKSYVTFMRGKNGKNLEKSVKISVFELEKQNF